MPSLSDTMRDAFGPQNDSLAAYGSAASPGAGATVLSIAAPPAGMYEVRVGLTVTAGATPSIINNYQLLAGVALVKRRFVVPVVTSATHTTPEYCTFVRFNGTDNLLVTAVGAEAASVTVSASVTARRVGP